MYDCSVEKRHPEGAFGRVAKSLIEAGSRGTYLPHQIDGAALLGDDDPVFRLLGDHPPQGRRRPDCRGAADASLDTIHLLLRSGAGAHAHAENQFGYTPLRAASETGHEDVAALLGQLDSPPAA
jgi:hypothetical protein